MECFFASTNSYQIHNIFHAVEVEWVILYVSIIFTDV